MQLIFNKKITNMEKIFILKLNNLINNISINDIELNNYTLYTYISKFSEYIINMIDFKIKKYIILFKNTELDIDSLIVIKNMILGFLFEIFDIMEKLSKLLIIYCIFSFIILNCLFIIVINIYKDFF